MLLSPLLAYFTLRYLEKSSTWYFQVIFIGLGLLYVLLNKTTIVIRPLSFLFMYFIYILIWSLYNGTFYIKGIFTQLNLDNVSTIFMIIVIYNTKFDDNFIKKSITVFKITAILAAIVSIIQIFDPSFFSSFAYKGFESEIGSDLYTNRRVSIFGFVNDNEVGLSYLPLACASIGFLLESKRATIIFYLLLVGLTAILTNGRYIIVGFVILTIQYLVIYKVMLKKILRYTYLILIIVTLFYFVLTLLFRYNLQEWYKSRLLPEGSLKETTRYKAMENFLVFFPQKPYFGTGVHMTDKIKRASNDAGSSQIHVGYLSHLVSFGMVGSFFLFGFWLMLAYRLYKNAKRTNYWGAFFAFLIFLWANATLVKYSIFFYGLIFALVFDKYYQDKYENRLILSKEYELDQAANANLLH
jgi:hypothetical protein